MIAETHGAARRARFADDRAAPDADRTCARAAACAARPGARAVHARAAHAHAACVHAACAPAGVRCSRGACSRGACSRGSCCSARASACGSAGGRGFLVMLARLLGLAARAARLVAGAAATAATASAAPAVGSLEVGDIEARHLDAGNGGADQLLDRLDEIAFGGRSQGERMAGLAGGRCGRCDGRSPRARTARRN